jgi:PAS domain S-box-containing protein
MCEMENDRKAPKRISLSMSVLEGEDAQTVAADPVTPAGRGPASDDLVRLLLDSTGDGIYGVDLEGNCTFANPACVRLLGFENAGELLGQHMHRLVHHTRPNGEPYPQKECRIYQAFRKREGTHVDDEVMFRKDGTSFPTEYWSYPVERGDELVGCVLTFNDITERRQREQELAEKSAVIAEMARFPEMNPGPVVRVDLDGKILMDNPAACDVFGHELIGLRWQDLCTEIDDETWNEILESTEPVSLERRVGDGYYLFAHCREPDTDLVFVFGADVTEQRKAEQGLRKADEFVRLLLDSTGEGIYGVDMEGNCTFANPACATLLGFDGVDDLLGKHMHKLVHHTRANGDPYPVEECRIYKAFRELKGTHVDDEVMFCSDGKPFPAEYWSYPVMREGELVGCVVTFVDITERRRVEEELRQGEKMAALGKLSAGLAHELNNPAAAAQSAAGQLTEALDLWQSSTIELAQAGLEPAQWETLEGWAQEYRARAAEPLGLSPLEASDREEELNTWLEDHGIDGGWAMAPVFVSASMGTAELDGIAATAPAHALTPALRWLCRALTAHDLAGVTARSSRSISELVGVAKSYSYMDQAELQFVDIHGGLEDTLTILRHKLKHGFTVVRDYDRALPQVEVHASELNQVWTNLIDNAIAAMGDGGTITVRTFLADEHIVVEIEDDGPGIPADVQPKIFDPFYTTKEVGKGTGLGLDVVRRIITARCGGKIDLRSKPGQTVFTVKLPVQRACETEDDSQQKVNDV